MDHSKIPGFEQVPLGFLPGNRLHWYVGKTLLLVVGFFFLWRVRVLGKGNLRRTQALKRSGAKVILDFDHFSSMDIPLPLVFFWWCGCRDLVRNLFFIIGYRWSERFLVKSADRCYVFPPSEAKKSVKKREGESFAERRQRFEERNSRIAAEFAVTAAVLEDQLDHGKLLWISSQGSRMRSGRIECAPSPNAIILVKKGEWLTPIALEGTEKILPPQKPGNGRIKSLILSIPRFWHPLTIIVGPPVWCETIKDANELGLLRARLHYLYGQKEMAGYYISQLEKGGVGNEEEKRRLASV